jgi:hypothetical protein
VRKALLFERHVERDAMAVALGLAQHAVAVEQDRLGVVEVAKRLDAKR